jgi:hypothetical protein
MKTTCIFDKNGMLINIGEWEEKIEDDGNGGLVVRNPLPEGAYKEDRDVIKGNDGGLYLQLDPLNEAEKFVAARFSSLQLLQMKTWKDEFVGKNTPKLTATYNWTSDIVKAAASGNTQFIESPYTFAEIIEECASLL